MQNTYTISHFMDALKKAGLPSTKPTILGYERRGVVTKPKNSMRYGIREHRLYTQTEIENNIERVRKYRVTKAAKVKRG